MEVSAVFFCQPVVQQDTLGMTNMEIAIWFRRESCHDFLISTIGKVFVDDLFNKIFTFNFSIHFIFPPINNIRFILPNSRPYVYKYWVNSRQMRIFTCARLWVMIKCEQREWSFPGVCRTASELMTSILRESLAFFSFKGEIWWKN